MDNGFTQDLTMEWSGVKVSLAGCMGSSETAQTNWTQSFYKPHPWDPPTVYNTVMVKLSDFD